MVSDHSTNSMVNIRHTEDKYFVVQPHNVTNMHYMRNNIFYRNTNLAFRKQCGIK